ncbi:uncharacterized protein F5147DRAFT_765963 [Suillus discolor]|uniref:Uncharacterized protein n=1 Tax=Suillus discolor TaxID=1912936 RepID=A0A9P7ERE3_9AGAM|nr:uncharacterized protein F5147DRAFT_765963 [Suillus discolor]KAG2080363.1 hypothetical protein F5147DRAFT_765963 [Suillus discolor]
MHMGQLPGPEPAYIPYPGYATYHPYGVQPHWTRGPAPQYTPVVPSTDAGAGVAHHAFQAGQNGHYPPAVGDVSRATQIGQYLPPDVAAPPPARTLYHQHFPSIPGGANPHAYAPPIPHQGIFNQHHGPELSMGSASSSLPQAPSCQVRRRCQAKKSTTSLHKIYSDPLFKPVVDEYGQPTGKFVCSIDGGEIGPHGYRKHMISDKHQGSKLKRIKCSLCFKSYTRGDSYKRHLDNGTCKRATAVVAPPSYPAGEDSGTVVAPPSYPAGEDSGSSASPAPVAAPTIVFAYACPYPRFAPPMSQNAQSGTPSFTTSVTVSQLEEEEEEEEEDDSDFWEANEI